MNFFGLGLVAVGYALVYWPLDILVQAYKRNTNMNIPPLSVVLGIPGSNANPTNTGLAGGPGPNVPGSTQAATGPGAGQNPATLNLTPSLNPNIPQWQGQ